MLQRKIEDELGTGQQFFPANDTVIESVRTEFFGESGASPAILKHYYQVACSEFAKLLRKRAEASLIQEDSNCSETVRMGAQTTLHDANSQPKLVLERLERLQEARQAKEEWTIAYEFHFFAGLDASSIGKLLGADAAAVKQNIEVIADHVCLDG